VVARVKRKPGLASYRGSMMKTAIATGQATMGTTQKIQRHDAYWTSKAPKRGLAVLARVVTMPRKSKIRVSKEFLSNRELETHIAAFSEILEFQGRLRWWPPLKPPLRHLFQLGIGNQIRRFCVNRRRSLYFLRTSRPERREGCTCDR
jgi:hypothetical protein